LEETIRREELDVDADLWMVLSSCPITEFKPTYEHRHCNAPVPYAQAGAYYKPVETLDKVIKENSM